MNEKIAIVGVGGRTGTMFAFELREQNDVLGISREATIKFLEENQLYINRNKSHTPFEGKVISGKEFSAENTPDIMFLATRNPISETLKYYFQKCGEKKPIFVLSQNGIDAIDSAKETLEEIAQPQDIRVVRLALFNAIDREGSSIKYSTPIKVALAQALGDKGVNEVAGVLKKVGFQVEVCPKKDAKNLEYSKLFLNLIGMASASRKLSIQEGFRYQRVFKEEVKALREYVDIVKSAGGEFINFSSYPVKLLTFLISLPLFLLVLFRDQFADIITKGRGDKPKQLGEIDYYNGAVVDLANELQRERSKKLEDTDYTARRTVDLTREFNPKAAVNQKIYWRAVEKMRESRNK